MKAVAECTFRSICKHFKAKCTNCRDRNKAMDIHIQTKEEADQIQSLINIAEAAGLEGGLD